MKSVFTIFPMAAIVASAAFPQQIALLSGTWWGFPPLLALFLFFVLGAWGWGLRFARALGSPAAAEDALLASSAIVYALLFLLGHLGLLGAAGKWTFVCFCAAGIFWARVQLSMATAALRATAPLWIFTVVFVLGLRFFSGFLPQAHGDPLLYHLLGPRLWMDMGVVRLHPELPNALLASTWEYLYLWPQLLVGQKTNEAGLVLAQIFSQWSHLVWGWLGMALACRQLFSLRTSDKNTLRLVFLVALFVPCLQWTGGLAKNDCGIAAWCLTAYYFWKRGRQNSAGALYFALAGAFAGLALAGKINAVLFLAPAFAVEAVLVMREKGFGPAARAFGVFCALVCSLALPIYLRNYLYTGNPFFPMFHGIFPSYWVSQSWADHFSAVQPTEGINIYHLFHHRVRQLAQEGPGIWAWIPVTALFFAGVKLPLWRKYADFFLTTALGLFLFVAGFKEDAELRYLGALLVLFMALSIALLYERLAGDPFAARARTVFVVLAVALLAFSKLPTHILWKYPKMEPGVAYVRTHTAGDAKAWLRAHVLADERIVVMGDNEMYYLSGLQVTVMTERPDIDAATYGKKVFAEFVDGLCSTSKAQYFFEARLGNGLKERFPGVDLTPAIIFRGASSLIYDLGKMEQIGGSSRYCRPSSRAGDKSG